MFKKINVSSSYFYVVEKDESIIKASNWAYKTAFLKSNYTEDTWQKRPNKYSKFVDIYYGDFAKNIVKAFLLNKNSDLDLIEFDLVRDDDFKNHDDYDLKLAGKEIEIKSSLEKYSKSTLTLLDNRRIIVNVGGSHETISDFVVQVFFVPNNLRRFEYIENQNRRNPNLSEEEVKKLCKEEARYSVDETTIYLVGWIDKQQEINAIQEAKQYKHGFGLKNYKSNAGYRKYANVLIKDSKHMDELVDVLTDLAKKDK